MSSFRGKPVTPNMSYIPPSTLLPSMNQPPPSSGFRTGAATINQRPQLYPRAALEAAANVQQQQPQPTTPTATTPQNVVQQVPNPPKPTVRTFYSNFY